ncbi:MAG TPA: ROK family protein, partial [Rubrivivax sp.]|nr:ROK family protein [Rubrivivax sp.]
MPTRKFATMTAAATIPALGIDLVGTKIESVLLDADGSTLMRQRRPTPAGDYTATLVALADVVRAARSAAGGDVTIGIGTPGSAGPDDLMKNCNSTWLNGQPLQADLQARVGQPVVLANDANCLAL